MGDASEGKRGIGSMEKLSLEPNRNPRDLLQRFLATNQSRLICMSKEEEEEEEEIELNLGLSLGGRFGVDKTNKKKLLMRSASIAGILPVVRDDGDAVAPPPVSYPAALIRTSSLPVETEEEWRKRKELQSLRRMEAKRRRSEKQRNSRGERDGGSGGEIEGNLRGRSEREQYMAVGRVGLAVVPPFGLPTWAARHGGGGGAAAGGLGFVQPSGSIESQGGSSSGMSESDSRPAQGSSSCGEASPSSIQSFQQRTNRERENTCKSSTEMETPSKRPEAFPERRGKETGSNSTDNMPCVFTQGDGPNGRRIDGILYRYGKGEEVRIMCVCHGSFHSPAEFVKHAGGSDVAHPLKHIVVNPTSSISF
ncbi:hypothetical protein RHMOL_Rhmol09G0180800 [Rhododendron molle]|uniref:Uncharacterized protein n=1 Tax=Rhododendron molle TaxID=49168 RepID=A0ACC0MGC3_RHOML|nr:hypothetical protein RHMOL_Rhmol09G0180800 [Rhododendron molle]